VVENNQLPEWVRALDEEDLHFVRRFLLASGSLKDVATDYSVSYPTVRARLDRLIAKVEAASDPKVRTPFERKVRLLVTDNRLSPAAAKELLQAFRATVNGGNHA
jgi:hypothetical protein